MAQTHCSLWKTSAVVIILLFVDHAPGDMGLDYTTTLSLLSVSLWFLLYVFNCRRSFLLHSGLFDQ